MIALPARPGVADGNELPSRYFAETGYLVQGVFLGYWDEHGGLPRFGYPISGETLEDGLTVQYFERARFERHADNTGTGYEVLLTRLGSILTASRDFPTADSLAGDNCFPETRHCLRGDFLSYWEDHGGLDQFGYPISEELTELSPTDHRPYTVQYFERARFEYHPDNDDANRILLGQLGTQMLSLRQKAATFVQLLGRQLVVGSDLHPIKLKGFNYFPRDFAWTDFESWPLTRVAFELDKARALGANVLRVFVRYDAFGGASASWSRQTAFRNFIAMARARNLYVLVNLFDGLRRAPAQGWDNWPAAGTPDEAQDLAYLRAVVGQWKDEPTVLAWDIYNEPDHVSEVEWQWQQHRQNRLDWLERMAAQIRSLDHNHPLTVGLALASSNELCDSDSQNVIGLVDFVSVHYYQQNYRNTSLDRVLTDLEAATNKPIIVEEAGQPTTGGAATEDAQARFLADTLHAVAATGTSGLLVWTLYDFSTHATTYEGHFGLFRADDSSKPAVSIFARGY